MCAIALLKESEGVRTEDLDYISVRAYDLGTGAWQNVFIVFGYNEKEPQYYLGGAFVGGRQKWAFDPIDINTHKRGSALAETPFTDTVNWHHVAAVFDEGVLAIYLDGKMVASRKADKTEVPSHGNNGGIGGTFDNNAFGENDKGKPGQVFDGLIDEVYIYSRALPPDEIAKYAQIVTPVPAKGNLPAMWGEVKSR